MCFSSIPDTRRHSGPSKASSPCWAERFSNPRWGLLTVAALLPADWELTLVDLTAREISSTEWQAADVVMLTGMGCQHASLIRTVRAAKRRGKPVVVGGSYAFHLPNALLDAGVDIVVRGEAEAIIPELRDALAERRSGIVIEGVERPELAASPVPRFDLLDLDQYVEMSIQFSRGCPYHCEFCDITLMFGHRVRTKPGERIIAELQTLFDLGWKDYIFFTDDNFIGNPSKAKTLLRKMVDWNAARGYPYQFVTQASVNLANDPELLDLMVKAGFTKVFLGIETPDRESLVLSKKVQNVATNMDDACRTINRAGLQIIAGCILGFDNERPGPICVFSISLSATISRRCLSLPCRWGRERACFTVCKRRVGCSQRPTRRMWAAIPASPTFAPHAPSGTSWKRWFTCTKCCTTPNPTSDGFTDACCICVPPRSGRRSACPPRSSSALSPSPFSDRE
jgi:hypothetical protein